MEIKNTINFDFEQAKIKHLLFKSRLRSILYGIGVNDDKPVLSQYECEVGKWIYSKGMANYGNIAEMQELEQVHGAIHTAAKKLVSLYRSGEVDLARSGLKNMENIADKLVGLLDNVKHKVMQRVEQGQEEEGGDKLLELIRNNEELDSKIKMQVQETQRLNDRFKLVSKATHDAVWDWDLLSNTVWWGEGFKNLFGYTDEEVKGNPEFWAKKIHPDDSSRVLQSRMDALNMPGKRWTAEYRFLKADKTYAHVLDRGFALYDEVTDKTFRMVGSMVDISDRKRMESSLRRSEAKFRRLSESSIVGVAFWNVDGYVYDANEAFLSILGYSRADLENGGINLKNSSLTEDHLQSAVIESAILGTAVAPFETRFAHKNGKVVHALVGFAMGEEGSSDNRIAFVTNITERKEAEMQLQQVFEMLPYLAWAMDASGNVIYMNNMWYSKIGVAALQGFNIQDYVHADDYELMEKSWQEALSGSSPYEGEYRLKDKTGEYRWMQIKINPILDSNKNANSWVGTAIDVHDKRVENESLENKVQERTVELKIINSKLERSNYDLMQFASVASHDLKEPLRKVQVYGSMLENKLVKLLDTEGIEYIGRMTEAADRMKILIDDILAYSKLSKESIPFQKISLNETIDQILVDFEVFVKEKKATIRMGDLGFILGEPIQIRQLFQNLISNSLKFCSLEKKLLITIESTEVNGLEIEQGAHQLFKKIVFKDNGIGFEMKFSEKIFTIFQRLHTRQSYEGTGIGLSIVKKVLDNHKGFIRVESILGEGATFILYLPEKTVV